MRGCRNKWIAFGIALSLGGCIEASDGGGRELEDLEGEDDAEAALSPQGRQARASAIRDAHASHGLVNNPVIFAGIAEAETGMAHCFDEFPQIACEGWFTSPDCGGRPIIAGGSNGSCEQGELGMFQFYEGTQIQTREFWSDKGYWPLGSPTPRDVVSLRGNVQASIDFVLWKAWFSNRTPFFTDTHAMYTWINGIRPIEGDADFELWLGFLAHNYNGWEWGTDGWEGAKDRYRTATLGVHQEFGGDSFWYGTPSEPPSGEVAFYLPFACDHDTIVTQGNDRTPSHLGTERYAFDFRAEPGTPIHAMADGIVTGAYAGTQPGHSCYNGGGEECAQESNFVVLQHADGTKTRYQHFNTVDVAVGDEVSRGTRIGTSGATGWATAPHLHIMRMENCASATYCTSTPLSFVDIPMGSPNGLDLDYPEPVTSRNCSLSSCGELAATLDYAAGRCEVNGNGACGGSGPATSDCEHCCDTCESGVTCGDVAQEQGWTAATCEAFGNGACGGQGVSTCDCDFCCPA